MKSLTIRVNVAAACLAAVLSAPTKAESQAGEFSDLVKNGSARLSFRYRYESVNQDNALAKANASTVRTRLTLQSAVIGGFSGLVEADNVTSVGPDDYDSLVDDKYRGTHAVVADPVGTEINQAYIKYAYTAGDFIGGRQRILHAGQRFVGGVGWRQNEQTYDAFTADYSTDKHTLNYSYLWGVNRIFDGSRESIQDTYFDSDSHILLATVKTGPGTFSGYVYALDFDDAAVLSSVTYGVGYSGSYKSLSFSASYATQSDYGDNPASYDADYLALEGKAKLAPVTFTLGYELLGSDDGVSAFKTPLATLHKFQGWADLFLATPNNGIEDIYGGLSATVGKVSLAATYHDFSAHEGGADYGSEIDLVATYRFTRNVAGELKYADYDADEFAVDTRKFWLSLILNF